MEILRMEFFIFILISLSKCTLDTRSFLSSAYKVQACCYNMVCSPASCQTLVNCQFVEVVSCINTVLIHLQLMANSIYSSFS